MIFQLTQRDAISLTPQETNSFLVIKDIDNHGQVTLRWDTPYPTDCEGGETP